MPFESKISAHAEAILSLSERVPLIFIFPFTQFSLVLPSFSFERSVETSTLTVGLSISTCAVTESLPVVSVTPETEITYLNTSPSEGFVPSFEAPFSGYHVPFEASISKETSGSTPSVPIIFIELSSSLFVSRFLIVPSRVLLFVTSYT